MPSKKIETKKKEFESRFVNHKLTGNVAYHEGFMNEAIEEFTFALAIYPQDAEVISARGDAYVKVRAFEKAKKDLQVAMRLEGTPSIMTLMRLCEAMWGLKEYQELLKILLRWKRSYEKRGIWEELKALVEITERMKMESATGKYDMVALNMKSIEQKFECGEYIGPITIDINEATGRGLRATRDIAAGDVIFGTNAIAIVYPGSHTGYERKYVVQGKDVMNSNNRFIRLVNVLDNMLTANPDLKEDLAKIHVEDDSIEAKAEENGCSKNPHRLMITRICYHNGILTGNEICSVGQALFEEEEDFAVVTSSRRPQRAFGLWWWPCFVNHKCIDSNSDFQKYGKFGILRATHDIKAGEEILCHYSSPTNPYDERRRNLENGCKCRLCLVENIEPQEIHEQRQELLDKAIASWKARNTSDEYRNVLETIVSKLDALRPNFPELNFPIVWLCRHMDLHIVPLDMCQTVAALLEKAYNLTTKAEMGSIRVRFGFQLILCYAKLENVEKAREWTRTLKKDLQCYYQTNDIKVLKIVAQNEGIETHDFKELFKYYLGL